MKFLGIITEKNIFKDIRCFKQMFYVYSTKNLVSYPEEGVGVIDTTILLQ